MTREEAIDLLVHGEWIYSLSTGNKEMQNLIEAISIIDTALRPVSREQAEKVWKAQDDSPNEKGQWFHCTNCDYGCDDYYSNNEIQMPNNNFQFCPCCGKAVTDKAMQIVMERLEEATSE